MEQNHKREAGWDIKEPLYIWSIMINKISINLLYTGQVELCALKALNEVYLLNT